MNLPCVFPRQRQDTLLTDGTFNILCLYIINSGKPSRLPQSELTTFTNTPQVKYQCITCLNSACLVYHPNQNHSALCIGGICIYYVYSSTDNTAL